MENITISIIEDGLEFQNWIQSEIQEANNITCTGVFDLAKNALAEIPAINPDIVIMNLELENSDMNSIECMLQLKIAMPNLKFLAFSSNEDERLIFEALRVGMGACMDKNETSINLTNAIQAFHAGGAPMSPGITRLIIKSFQRTSEELKLFNNLTSKEKQVLQLLSKGFLLKEIADMLGITEGTVKQHTHKIYKKLQVNNRTEAINRYLN